MDEFGDTLMDRQRNDAVRYIQDHATTLQAHKLANSLAKENNQPLPYPAYEENSPRETGDSDHSV